MQSSSRRATKRGSKNSNVVKSKLTEATKPLVIAAVPATLPPGFSLDTVSKDAGQKRHLRAILVATMNTLARNNDLVDVSLLDGSCYRGHVFVFHILKTGQGAYQLGIKKADCLSDPTASSSSCPGRTYQAGGILLFSSLDIARLLFPSTKLGGNSVKSSGILTDTEISRGDMVPEWGRPLQAANSWLGDPLMEEVTSGGLEEENGLSSPSAQGPGAWDQFHVNATKFGVQTTYDENLYTTKLDKTLVSSHQMKMADKLAKEIERTSVKSVAQKAAYDAMDEESRHSSVLRSEANELSSSSGYVPLNLLPRHAKDTGSDRTTAPPVRANVVVVGADVRDPSPGSTPTPALTMNYKAAVGRGGLSTASSDAVVSSVVPVSTSPSPAVTPAIVPVSSPAPKTLKPLNPSAKAFTFNVSAATFVPPTVTVTPSPAYYAPASPVLSHHSEPSATIPWLQVPSDHMVSSPYAEDGSTRRDNHGNDNHGNGPNGYYPSMYDPYQGYAPPHHPHAAYGAMESSPHYGMNAHPSTYSPNYDDSLASSHTHHPPSYPHQQPLPHFQTQHQTQHPHRRPRPNHHRPRHDSNASQKDQGPSTMSYSGYGYDDASASSQAHYYQQGPSPPMGSMGSMGGGGDYTSQSYLHGSTMAPSPNAASSQHKQAYISTTTGRRSDNSVVPPLPTEMSPHHADKSSATQPSQRVSHSKPSGKNRSRKPGR